MALSEDKIKGYIKRLLLSRMRILCNHGFYGLLLMHMIYAVSEDVETACTDGVRITFGTGFLDDLTDAELDFVMMHEILHVVLQHCLREDVSDHDAYNIAADIVVNSNILLENGGKASSITLSKYGISIHVAPDGKEGHEYTAEQVYAMLPKKPNKKGIAKDTRQSVWAWDDHSQWGKYGEDDTLRDVWVKRFEDAAEAVKIRDPSNTRGLIPAFAQRILKELKKPQTDWRTILNDFIQEEVKYPEHHRRDLLLSDQISQGTVKEIIKDILEINYDDDAKEEIYKDWERKPIQLFINSYGGSVYDGLALIDVIKRSKTPVHTVCIGSCMSMALWVWLVGAKRFVGESATLMFHDVSLFAYDKTEGIKQELNEMIRLQEMLVSEIVENSMVKEETLRDYISRKAEWYIPANEAITLKLADKYYK